MTKNDDGMNLESFHGLLKFLHHLIFRVDNHVVCITDHKYLTGISPNDILRGDVGAKEPYGDVRAGRRG